MSEVSPIHGIAVLGTVACGPGQEEEQRFIETIRMPETLVEKGDYFALIAKGESRIGVGVLDLSGMAWAVHHAAHADVADQVTKYCGIRGKSHVSEDLPGLLLQGHGGEGLLDSGDILLVQAEGFCLQYLSVFISEVHRRGQPPCRGARGEAPRRWDRRF